MQQESFLGYIILRNMKVNSWNWSTYIIIWQFYFTLFNRKGRKTIRLCSPKIQGVKDHQKNSRLLYISLLINLNRLLSFPAAQAIEDSTADLSAHSCNKWAVGRKKWRLEEKTSYAHKSLTSLSQFLEEEMIEYYHYMLQRKEKEKKVWCIFDHVASMHKDT